MLTIAGIELFHPVTEWGYGIDDRKAIVYRVDGSWPPARVTPQPPYLTPEARATNRGIPDTV